MPLKYFLLRKSHAASYNFFKSFVTLQMVGMVRICVLQRMHDRIPNSNIAFALKAEVQGGSGGFISTHPSPTPVIPANGARQPLGSIGGLRHGINGMGGPGGPRTRQTRQTRQAARQTNKRTSRRTDTHTHTHTGARSQRRVKQAQRHTQRQSLRPAAQQKQRQTQR